jgi:hypothetical protein
VAHAGNLFLACRRFNILSPLALTPAQVIPNINECMTQLDDLKKDALRLWNIYLRECLFSAQVREDTASIIAIQKILCAELICCRWRSVWRATNPNREGAVTRLTVPHPSGDTLYATREGVESQGAAAIEIRYKVAQGTYFARCPPTGQLWIPGKYGFR